MQRPAYFHAGAESTIYLARAPWKPSGRRAKNLTVGIALAASQTGVHPPPASNPQVHWQLEAPQVSRELLGSDLVEQSID